jgi:hypothetical protein
VASPTIQPLEGRLLLSGGSRPAHPRIGPALAGSADAGVAPAPGAAAVGAGFVPMFNAVNTAGWFNPYDWGRAWAQGGQIFLSSPKNFFLVAKQPYSNFILQADVLIPPGGNSGVQFRSRYGHNFMEGYQADMDTGDRNWAGGLWDQTGGWLARPAHRAPVIPGHWNHYEVEAIGDHITIIVNGKVTVDTHNKMASTGYIALQDHGSPGLYHFKDVEIENLGG